MNVLIVHAHPEARSFTTALKDVAVDELTLRGHIVEVSDLYAMHFDPVAKADDFSSRKDEGYLVYALEQRHALNNGGLAPDIAAEVDKLKRADLIILSFPMFWFSVPALMKGWIDRVLLSGLCYGGRRFYDQGGLRGKRMLAAFSLGSRENMFGTDAIHGELEAMLRPLLRGTFYYVGCEVLEPFIAWHVPYVTAADRRLMLDQYRVRLAGIASDVPLPFPSLNDFDDQMRPRVSQR
jgi:NAD(P)H dehydrogenase (quinone)